MMRAETNIQSAIISSLRERLGLLILGDRAYQEGFGVATANGTPPLRAHNRRPNEKIPRVQ
jgi:hypothetical protein